MGLILLWLAVSFGCATGNTPAPGNGPEAATPDPLNPMPSFAAFRDKAESGQRVDVVFLGGSLTWGANASDPQRTSYRALVADRLMDRFPRTPFRFHDAAIGGTGSQLGGFRLGRDVLARGPDLVFLDFTANDNIRTADPETLSSYEWIVRRVIRDADAVVVPVVFPFRGEATQGDLTLMPGRDATLRIAEAYRLPVGDAVVEVQRRLAGGEFTAEELWPWDGAHPDDPGYAVFADAAWAALETALADGRAVRVPDEPLHGDRYRHVLRAVLAEQDAPLPPGWRVDTPSRVAAWYDGLMSRWLGRVAVAGGPDATPLAPPAPPAPLRATFRARCVGVFGEETLTSGRYRVLIDGQPVTPGKDRPAFDASSVRMGGNRQHFVMFATGLEESVDHTLEIIPELDAPEPDAPEPNTPEPDATPGQELRLESVCLAGSRRPAFALQRP